MTSQYNSTSAKNFPSAIDQKKQQLQTAMSLLHKLEALYQQATIKEEQKCLIKIENDLLQL